MEHKHLVCFLAVCDMKSFSKAAESLYITQQGLGKCIRQLEEELGVPLFQRSTKGVTLTEFGLLLEKNVRPYLNSHDHIVSLIRDAVNLSQKKLTIGISGGMGDFSLPRNFFTDFILEHPEIQVNLQSFYDESCIQSLMDAKINIGFCTMAFDPNLFLSKFHERRRHSIIVSTNHRLADKNCIHLQDLAGEKLARPMLHPSTYDEIDEKLHMYGVDTCYSLTFADYNLATDLIARGCAIGFYAGRADMLPPGIVQVPVEDLDLYMEYHLLVSRSVDTNETVQTFLDYTYKRLT